MHNPEFQTACDLWPLILTGRQILLRSLEYRQKENHRRRLVYVKYHPFEILIRNQPNPNTTRKGAFTLRSKTEIKTS